MAKAAANGLTTFSVSFPPAAGDVPLLRLASTEGLSGPPDLRVTIGVAREVGRTRAAGGKALALGWGFALWQ